MPNIETCAIIVATTDIKSAPGADGCGIHRGSSCGYTKRTCAKSFSTRFDDSGETYRSVSDLIKLKPDEFTMKQIRFAEKRLGAHTSLLDDWFTALGETALNSIRATKYPSIHQEPVPSDFGLWRDIPTLSEPRSCTATPISFSLIRLMEV